MNIINRSLNKELLKASNIISLGLVFIFFNIYVFIIFFLVLLFSTALSSTNITANEDYIHIKNPIMTFKMKNIIIPLNLIERINVHYFDSTSLYVFVILKIKLKNKAKDFSINLGSNLNLADLEALEKSLKMNLGEKINICYII